MTSASIHPSAVMGTGCDVHPSAVVGANVRMGDGVRIGPGVLVEGPCTIGDRCVLEAGSVVGPGDAEDGNVVIEQDARLSAGAIVRGGLVIAGGARVQAGAVVLRSVPPHAIVAGNPAQIVGYVPSFGGEGTDTPAAPGVAAHGTGAITTRVRGVTLHRLPRVLDLRGNLSVGEFGRSVPFAPKRYFLVFGVPNAEIRGEHAHRTCKQFLVCVNGSCSVVADDGRHREEFVLDDPAIALYLPPLTWGIQYKYSADAVLLVFASEFYDSAEYIRDYAEFRRLAEMQA